MSSVNSTKKFEVETIYVKCNLYISKMKPFKHKASGSF